MPLSPADFYAYSQATGAPVADTPEKRAQQAPQVLAFRQQQLQAPKQGPGLLDVLGKTALLAGVAAGGYGIARALRNRGIEQGVQEAVVHDVTNAAEENVRRAAAYQGTPPSRVATTAPSAPAGTIASPTPGTQKPNFGVQLVNIQNVTADPWHSDSIAHSIANEAAQGQNRPTTPLLPPASRPSSYDQLKNYTYATGRIAPAETLVDQQHAILGNTINQSINAITSAEDQVTGRMKHLLQQDPHMDMSQVELMEEMAEHSRIQGMEQDEPIHQVAQALGRSTTTQQDEVTGPEAAAQHFAQQRLQLASQGIKGLRAEKALAQPYLPGAPYVEGAEGYQQRQQKRGLALGLQTGDPNVLKVFQTGELPSKVNVPWGGTQLGELPTSAFFHETTLPEAVVGAQTEHQANVNELKSKLADITNEIQPQIDQLEHRQYQEYVHAQNRIPEIDEQLMMINHHLAKGPSSGSGELLGYRGALTAERNKLSQHTGEHLQDQIDQLNYRLSRAHDVYGNLISEQTVNVPQTLKSWSPEALKVAPEQISTQQAGYIDPATGEFRPVTQVESGPSVPILTQEGLTLGSVSKPRDIGPKGGGGRNVAEYVAGNRPVEVVRTVGGPRYGTTKLSLRDYDPVTGGVAEHYQSDLTQSTRQIGYDPKTGKRVINVSPGLNRAIDPYGVRLATQDPSNPNLPPSKVAPSRFPLGPQRQEPTEAGRQSIDLSRTIQGIYASGRPTAHQEVQQLIESLKAQQNLM